MSNQIDGIVFTKQLLTLLEEAFEKVHGIFLDGGTSFFETLAPLTAAQASCSVTAAGSTIAGQVTHVRFYLKVLEDYIDGKSGEKVDWKQSWLTRTVTAKEWDALRQGLKDDYTRVVAHLQSIIDWNDDRRLGGAISIVVHTAYHLGAVRQILHVARK
jgi:hypothetical protein